MKSPAYALMLMLLLPACASKPQASPPIQVECPRPAPLVKLALGESFISQAERILFGLPKEQTSSVQDSPPVTEPTTR